MIKMKTVCAINQNNSLINKLNNYQSFLYKGILMKAAMTCKYGHCDRDEITIKFEQLVDTLSI